MLIFILGGLADSARFAEFVDVFSHRFPPVHLLNVLRSLITTVVAHYFVGFADNYFYQLPPPQKSVLGDADHITAQLIFCVNQLIFYTKHSMRVWVGQYHSKYWVLFITLLY